MSARILVLYGKDPSGIIAAWQEGRAPATFLYGLPLFGQFGVHAEPFIPARGRFSRMLFGFLRRASRELGTLVSMWRLSFVIRRYDALLIMNADAVIGAVLFRALFAPRVKVLFYNDRAERVAGKQWLKRRLFKQCDVIIAQSIYQAQFTKTVFGKEGPVVYLGSDRDFFRPDGTVPEDFVLSVGGDPGRDFETLVGAARRLPDIGFVFVGRASKMQGLETPSNVTVHQNVPPTELRQLYRRARLVVIPLYGDHHEYGSEMPGAYFSGMTVLGDCAALGKAVVMTATTSARELLGHGRTAELVEPEDAGELASAIRRVYGEASYRESLGRNLSVLYESFSTEQTVRAFTRIIHSTVAGKD